LVAEAGELRRPKYFHTELSLVLTLVDISVGSDA
jgi:hypothetical protein